MGTSLRHSRTRRAGLAGLAAVVLLLTGCGSGDPAPAEPEPEPLSATRAGGLYLSAVCPVNDAWDAADLELDRLRLALGRGEADTEALAEALRDVADASAEAADELGPKRQSWPESASSAIAAVRASLTADERQALTVSKMSASKIVAYTWQGSDDIATAAADARAALGLPADAETACAQWAEQQASAEAEKPEAEKPESEKPEAEKPEPGASDTKNSSSKSP